MNAKWIGKHIGVTGLMDEGQGAHITRKCSLLPLHTLAIWKVAQVPRINAVISVNTILSLGKEKKTEKNIYNDVERCARMYNSLRSMIDQLLMDGNFPLVIRKGVDRLQTSRTAMKGTIGCRQRCVLTTRSHGIEHSSDSHRTLRPSVKRKKKNIYIYK